MGNTVSHFGSFFTANGSAKKRPLSDSTETQTPSAKRFKKSNAPEYIYEKLFKSGEDSDIKIISLNKEWPLHRIYLKQSPYFEALFEGNWRDSANDVLHIDIVDENVTEETMSITFGSLYSDNFTINSSNVLGVLICARYLQLEHLIGYCLNVIEETVNATLLLKYYLVGVKYGVDKIEQLCLKWLEYNLLSNNVKSHTQCLGSLPFTLVQKAVSSNKLFVIQSEISVYNILKLWLFLQLFPSFKGDETAMVSQANKFFQGRKNKSPFLETVEGEKYRPLFWTLNFSAIVCHSLDVDSFDADNIIPHSWLLPVICKQWYLMLRVKQRIDIGAKNLPDEVFEKHCSRFGRIIETDALLTWRWSGFNFDFDTVLSLRNKTIFLKRNVGASDMNFNWHKAKRRHLMVQISVCHLNNEGREVYFASTEILNLSLQCAQEVHLMDIEMKLPLMLCIKTLLYTPKESYPFTKDSALNFNSECPLLIHNKCDEVDELPSLDLPNHCSELMSSPEKS